MFGSRLVSRIRMLLYRRNLSEYDNKIFQENRPIAYRGISGDLSVQLYGRSPNKVQWGYGDGRIHKSRIFRDGDGREYFQAGRFTLYLDEFTETEE